MSDPAPRNPQFWRRKLAAYLHDPPDKCFDLRGHEESARQFLAGAGIGDGREAEDLLRHAKAADHFAAAADRFVFPKGKCSTTFDGQPGSGFLHPLSSQPHQSPEDLVPQAGHLHGVLQDAIGGIATDDPRATFFLYWRRWFENTATSGKANAASLAFLPADSRLPDHTIWNHMATVSAVAGCLGGEAGGPAFLLFQLGPVQDFIAQARSTRDLWSGSYLLSWLVAHSMKAVSDEIGPDAIIFPSLRGNGIFDALHREEVYQHTFRHGEGREQTCWQRMLDEKGRGLPTPEEREACVARWLLTPTLPNRFLALVPAARAEELARQAEQAVHAELCAIGDAVWQWVETEAGKAKCPDVGNWRARWDAQLAAFPQIAWAVQPWLDRKACLDEFRALPTNLGKGDTPCSRLHDMLAFGETWLPQEDRDERYYADTGKTKLKNPGVLWSAHYALADAKLAARRNTRDFAAWSDPAADANGTPKDSLSGKEECIGSERFWEYLGSTHKKVFKTASHRYGAMNLLKRLWCRSDLVPYLPDRLGLSAGAFGRAIRFDSVQKVACKNTVGEFGRKDDDGAPIPKNPYVAVLAMDGDEMGKWVSGEKTPAFLEQVSANARKYLEPILRAQGKPGLPRLLTPSYHLQFSEALANFATWLADPIVAAFDGQLIYAGGDDVLAMLPADRAVACARALRAVFRGEPPAGEAGLPLAVVQPGYVLADAGYPLVVPGSRADVSIGLAVGHCDAPLQMLVREAQAAEKTAKKTYERGALAISLYKRSGETILWGCKWDEGSERVALRLMERVTALSKGVNAPLSGRFPYALAALLQPYCLEGTMPQMKPVVEAELAHALRQQGSGLDSAEREALAELGRAWLEQTAGRLEDFANLFLVETFINRPRGED